MQSTALASDGMLKPPELEPMTAVDDASFTAKLRNNINMPDFLRRSL